ncbi:hypothetical protein BCR37DRAFT_383922 [Protomyces lactucae-debilis]|uniref:Uncharacterized protein n=1 Tax=Protomyces lactucae-debilis TaxID=2754530 RepID=A0A1Y2EXD7_PROLT|nr:uncharacterized protein BCR37DRAFT_383922 [Protomyces lactucae-debilis]ORY75786.1 hypothetical protein BCR37DRAFT_383922 [Protomyces lactucae-debilis]
MVIRPFSTSLLGFSNSIRALHSGEGEFGLFEQCTMQVQQTAEVSKGAKLTLKAQAAMSPSLECVAETSSMRYAQYVSGSQCEEEHGASQITVYYPATNSSSHLQRGMKFADSLYVPLVRCTPCRVS